MKKLLRSFLILAALLVFSATYAQEQRNAFLTPEGIIQLSDEHEPNGRFEIDLGEMEFESSSAMTAYFQERCDENIILRAIPAQNKVLMVVKGDTKPNWTVSDWNNYLDEKLSEQPILPQE